MTGFDLAALVGARICHDLISPVGAIGNGVELLHLSAAPPGPEVTLISESVDSANARIRFFRIAFGPAAEDQTVARSEVVSVLAAIAANGRTSYLWDPDGPLARLDARSAFLAILCIETAMPHGGEIAVRRDATGWEVTGRGDRMRADPALWDALSGGAEPPVKASQVQFALLRPATAACGRDLHLRIGDDDISIRF